MSHCLIDNAELLPGLDLRCVGAEVVAIGDPAAADRRDIVAAGRLQCIGAVVEADQREY